MRASRTSSCALSLYGRDRVIKLFRVSRGWEALGGLRRKVSRVPCEGGGTEQRRSRRDLYGSPRPLHTVPASPCRLFTYTPRTRIFASDEFRASPTARGPTLVFIAGASEQRKWDGVSCEREKNGEVTTSFGYRGGDTYTSICTYDIREKPEMQRFLWLRCFEILDCGRWNEKKNFKRNNSRRWSFVYKYLCERIDGESAVKRTSVLPFARSFYIFNFFSNFYHKKGCFIVKIVLAFFVTLINF